MLRLEKPPSKGAKMVLTVHDELVFEVPKDELVEARENIREAIELYRWQRVSGCQRE